MTISSFGKINFPNTMCYLLFSQYAKNYQVDITKIIKLPIFSYNCEILNKKLLYL